MRINFSLTALSINVTADIGLMKIQEYFVKYIASISKNSMFGRVLTGTVAEYSKIQVLIFAPLRGVGAIGMKKE